MVTNISFHSLTLNSDVQKSLSVMATTLNCVPGNKVLFYDFFYETRDCLIGCAAVAKLEKTTQLFEEAVLDVVPKLGLNQTVQQTIAVLLKELANAAPCRRVRSSDIADYKTKSAEITTAIIGNFFKNRCNALALPHTPSKIVGTKSRMKGTVHQSALKEHPKYIGAFITSLLPYFEHTDTLVVPVLLSGTAQLSFLPNTHHLLARLCTEYIERETIKEILVEEFEQVA
jgi:hypothetical protein